MFLKKTYHIFAVFSKYNLFLWNIKPNSIVNMKENILKKYGLTLLGIAVGALGGYLYWRFVGCSSGTCPITSSPLNSSIWGALMGGLVFNMFQKEKKDE